MGCKTGRVFREEADEDDVTKRHCTRRKTNVLTHPQKVNMYIAYG